MILVKSCFIQIKKESFFVFLCFSLVTQCRSAIFEGTATDFFSVPHALEINPELIESMWVVLFSHPLS
jgi:hypothetical protein